MIRRRTESKDKDDGADRQRAPKNPLDSLHFLPWSAGLERLAKIWCALFKPGTSVEAIKLSGGVMARWPCFPERDRASGELTGEKRMGRYTVVALPCYEPSDPDVAKAWVIWNVSGSKLEIYRGPDTPPDEVKMCSVGGTSGLLMGKLGLDCLGRGRDKGEQVSIAFKTAGPSDMLALMTVTPPDLHALYPVVTNASGETGSVTAAMANVFRGQNLAVIHDADEAGEIGAGKWVKATSGIAKTVRHWKLPYAVTEKHGMDLRDWLAGEPGDNDHEIRHRLDHALDGAR